MDAMSRSFGLEGLSWRKIGRSNSSLVASELVGSETAEVAAYERLSASMWVTANDYAGGYNCRRNKIRSWSFLVKALSFGKRVCSAEDVCRGQVVNKAVVKPPEVAAEKKKKKSTWLPDPHRRWPVQGW